MIWRIMYSQFNNFQLDPLSQLEIYYLEVLDLQEGVFNEDENIYTYPAIAIFFVKRKWLFNTLTGECLVNELALSNEKLS